MMIKKYMSMMLLLSGVVAHVPLKADAVDQLASALATIEAAPNLGGKEDVKLQDDNLLNQKQKDLLKGNKDAANAWNKLNKEQRKKIAPKLDEVVDLIDAVQGGTVDIFIQSFESKIIKDPQAEEIVRWLGKEGKVFEKAVDNTRQEFTPDVWKDFFKQTAYKNPLMVGYVTLLKGIENKAAKSNNTGRLSIDDKTKKDLKNIFNDFSTQLGKNSSFLQDQKQQKEFRRHLEFMVMLDPSLLPDVIELTKKYDVGESPYGFMVELYKLNIGYVEKILPQLSKGQLTGDNKKDFDFAVGYYTYIKPYLDRAELDSGEYSTLTDQNAKADAKKFVKDINDLNEYLIKLLYKGKDVLEQGGFDFSVVMRLAEDETQRKWCGWHISDFNQVVDGAYGVEDRHKTYKPGNVSFLLTRAAGGSRYEVRDHAENVALDSDGRPIENPKQKWNVVDKKNEKGFYKRYYVELEQIRELIQKYKEYIGKKDVFESIQKARVQLIVSAINKFAYYLKVACVQGFCTRELCEHCFRWDLNGSIGDSAYSFRVFKDGSYRDDRQKIMEISENIDNNLKAAYDFLEEIQKKDQNNSSIQQALKAIKNIQAYKERGCRNVTW